MAKNKTQNFFVWIVMGLLFVGLMGFGATGLSGNIRTIGDVGEKPLSAQRYYQELQSQISVRSSQLGRRMSFPEAEAEGMPLGALQAVVAERSLDNEAAQLGLSVGDDTISAQVLSNPAFRGVDGAFDTATYRDALGRTGLNVREYETTLRESAARALVQGAVFTGIDAPETYGRAIAQFTREGRTFTWAPLTADDFDVIQPEPSEDDLQAHYDANHADFTAPETRQIRYVWLTPDMIQDYMPVDEAELRAEYEARIEEYVQPERRLIERLVFSDDAEAQAALDAITAGETTFPELVLDRGLTLNDVDAGDVTQDEMGDAGTAIFALETGGVTGPFATDLGPALFRMNAVLAARSTSFEDALPELRGDQAANRARRVIEDQIDPITNLLAGGAQLSDVADQTDMVLGEIEWTTAVTTGIAAYAAFRDVAAAQDPSDFAELADLDDGGLFAIEVLDVRAPALIPLDDVRADVIAGWEAAQFAEAVLTEARAKAAQLGEGVSDFTFVGLTPTEETDITRRGFIIGTPPTFLTDVFEMQVNDINVLPNGDAALIVRLDAISAADTEDEAFAAEVAAISETAGEGIAQDVYELFNRTVQLRTDVQINDAAVNAVHTNFR
jgi:peptidyl-prolyl cis-trans isomerase D